MDPIKVLKGYGKVKDLEDQAPPKSCKKSRLIALAISAVVLCTLLIGLIVGDVIRNSVSESSESPSLSSNMPAEMIRAVCNETLYPDSCFASISSLKTSPNPDPEEIFKLSLQISVAELSMISKILKASNSTLNGGAAMADCETQIEDALSRLNDSITAVSVDRGEKMLTETKISDLQTWISGAMTEEESCLDGLEEMESKFLEEMRKTMEKSKEFMSISLAILGNIQKLLKQFNMSLH